MSISGLVFRINNYGIELDSFLGAIYLPWHTIVPALLIFIGYKVYKRLREVW